MQIHDWMTFWTAVIALSGIFGAAIGASAVVRAGRIAEAREALSAHIADERGKMQAESNAAAFLSQGSVDILRFLASQGSLYDYFYVDDRNQMRSHPAREHPDYAGAMLAAEMIATFAENILRQLSHLQNEGIRDSWRNYATAMCQSPTVRRHVSMNLQWYSSELRKLAGFPNH